MVYYYFIRFAIEPSMYLECFNLNPHTCILKLCAYQFLLSEFGEMAGSYLLHYPDSL